MSGRTHTGDFSESVIQRYLDTKAYEARGLTREQYVEACRVVWNKVRYDPEYERKVIIDHLQPLTLGQLIGADQLSADFLDAPFLEAPVHGFEGNRDIECLVMLTARVPPPGSHEVVQYPVAETFRPAEIPPEPAEAMADFYLVALFDVLGFSALVQRIGAEAILDIYKNLIAATILNTNFTGLARVEYQPGRYTIGGVYAPIGYAYFSDTILLWTPARLTHFAPFLARCGDLICEALRIGLPLRGGISAGEAIMHKASQTFLGSALVEANTIEKNQVWIGATLGEGFVVKDLKEGLTETLVVPLFCDHFKPAMEVTVPYLTLDWVGRWKTGAPSDLIQLLEGMRDRSPEANRVYYDNTITFVRYRELDDSRARREYLRASTYRVRNIEKVNLRALHGRPVVLKVRDEIPRCGFLLSFSDEMLTASSDLRDLVKDNLLFVRRRDYQRFLDSLPKAAGEFDLFESGAVWVAAKEGVEYVDIFLNDPNAPGRNRAGDIDVVD